MDRSREITSRVTGFLMPEFTQKLENGLTLNGLTEEGFRMIQEGYACGECLAMFTTYTVKCPICGLSRDVAADVQAAPQLWLDHLHERYREDMPDKPAVVNPFAPPNVTKGTDPLASLPQEIETIPISKLRKPKAKR